MARDIIKIEFIGDGLEPTTILDVTYAHAAQGGAGLSGPDGTCAYCHGDPCAERPCAECGGGYMRFLRPPEGRGRLHVPHAEGCGVVTFIDRYMINEYAETCPACNGRPT